MIHGKFNDLFSNVMKEQQVGIAMNTTQPGRSGGRAKAITEGTESLMLKRKSVLSIRVQETIHHDEIPPMTPRISGNRVANSCAEKQSPSTSVRENQGVNVSAKKPVSSTTSKRQGIHQLVTTSTHKRAKTSSAHASTLHFRASNRIHTRILTKKGGNITMFTSSVELLLAFSGAIRGHVQTD